MRLSIFPAANPHPKGKEEKNNEAYKFSAPNYPETVEFDDEDELVRFVTSYAWSPFIFDGYRREENFLSTDFLVFDIDYGMTIEECASLVKKANLCCLCLPSPSHTDEAQRFRVILPLERPITNLEVYALTWRKGATLFGAADEQCKDGCRGYFGSTEVDGFWTEGELFAPVFPVESPVDYTGTDSTPSLIDVTADINEIVTQIYGEQRQRIPEAVDFFIKNAKTGLDGEWNCRLNSFVFSLSLSNVESCAIISICEQLAPLPLDKKDLYQIKRAIKDGQRESNR